VIFWFQIFHFKWVNLYRYNAEMRIRVRQGAYAVGLVQVETLNPKPYTLYPIP
jgi:hypothetical protein